jgi:Ni,Fe-hydrogenase III large subunit
MSAITEKLVKANEAFTINRYDNGFMIEVGGRDDNDDWKTAKVIVGTEDELVELIRETLALPLTE